MAFPNSTYTDIVTSTMEKRSKKVADNVTKNNALLFRLKQKGKVQNFSGGRTIVQELSFAENPNAQAYSGYDTLSTAAADVLSAAEYAIKQYACPVVMSGLEDLQNGGEEALLDLMEERMGVGESSMHNLICDGLYSDGTGYGGKEIGGLDLLVPADPTTGTAGGINRANYTFWRPKLNDVTITAANVLEEMNQLWAQLVRGAEHPDLIMVGSTFWTLYMAAMQGKQQFTDPALAQAGFSTIKFLTADVVLDGGIGGFADAEDAYFLNTKYIHYRPHSRRNMVPLKKRSPVNQDAEIEILAWAGNLTCSGGQFQGRITGD